jgi:hypothetical protein
MFRMLDLGALPVIAHASLVVIASTLALGVAVIHDTTQACFVKSRRRGGILLYLGAPTL